MVEEARCRHDMYVSQCGICCPPAGPPPARALDPGSWFTARYHGRCSLGDEHIHPGDLARGDGEGGYLCESCGEGFD
jgi:hypothetical protein